MKRVEIHSPAAPLSVRTCEIPDAPEGGVVIKTSFCGICHSDIHVADDSFSIGGENKLKLSDNPLMKFPIVLGHEISGVVHSIGKDAQNDGTDLKVGDKVIVYPWTGCDNCGFCNSGNSNFCKITMNVGVERKGGYAEYVSVVNRDNVIKVPETLPMEVASMLPCSGVTGYNAVSKIKPTIEHFVKNIGQATLLIIGAGGLGLWCLQTARASLPKNTRLISADISREKLDSALGHGADDTVLWDASLCDADIIKMTKEKGTDGEIHAVIDFVNNSITAPRGLACLAKGGAMALVGLFGGSMQIPLPLFAFGLTQMFGVFVGSRNQMKEFVDLVAAAKLKPPELTYVSIEEVPSTLEKLRKGEITGRALVKF